MIYWLLSKPFPSPAASPHDVIDPGASQGFGKIAVAIIIVGVVAIVIGAVTSGNGPSKR